jgi:O-antigen/teichoic acid export membrane protein
MADLKGRSVRGGTVTLSAQAIKFVFQLASTAVLARLLTPADFGLVAMVAAFTGFVSLFKDLGLSMATVQRVEITHEQVSTLFWINVVLSVVLMGVAAVLAPAVAWFYAEPKLIWIMLAVASTFVFGGLSAQHTALLRRQMRFTALAIIEIGSMVAGIAVAVVMACRGFAYWSLVAMGATTAATTMLLCWLFSGWQPAWPRRGTGVMPMVKFGGNVTSFNVLNYFARNLDNIIIGRFLGPLALGLYSKAYGLLLLPLQQVNAPVASVVIPALSRLQSDSRRYRHCYLTAVKSIAWVTGPLIVVLAIYSQEIVSLVLGKQWESASGLFKVLALGSLLQPISATVGWLFVSLGRTRELMTYGSLAVPALACSFCIGLLWGTMGVAVCYVTVWNLLVCPLGFFLALKHAPLSVKQVIGAVWRPLLVSVLLFAAGEIAHYSLSHLSLLARSGWTMAALVAAAATTIAGFSTIRGDLVGLWTIYRTNFSANESYRDKQSLYRTT